MWDSRLTIRAEEPVYAGKIVRSTLDGANSEAVENAVLLTSELVTDAMSDPDADPQLFIDRRRGHIYVEVRDTDSIFRRVETSRIREWTAVLLNSLASSWGMECHTDSRAVWFVLSF